MTHQVPFLPLSRSELHWSDLLFLGDLVGHELGRVQDLDGALVLQDVPFGRLQRLQDLVLDLFQLLLVSGRLQDQGVPLLLQLWPGAEGGEPPLYSLLHYYTVHYYQTLFSQSNSI